MKKFKLVLILLLIFIAIGTASASDNSTDTLASKNIRISESNYDTYFDERGILIDSMANPEDIIELSGTFNNYDFIFNKSVNVRGVNSNINNGSVVLLAGASGSSISNLIIKNTQFNMPGINIIQSSNNKIFNNNINNRAISSYAICLDDQSNYNNISNNVLKTSGELYGGQSGTRSTSVIVLGDSHHNYIAGNDITSDDANGIYFSFYSGGSFKGGVCNYNTIYNNTIRCAVIPTSWNYAIQMMGSNNTADSNTIIGTYRGISSTTGNIIINNNLINLTGADFLSGKQVGGDYAIIAESNSYVANNTIANSLTSTGIYVGDYSTVENNIINIEGSGIGANGNNILIQNNIINSKTGIYQSGQYTNLKVNSNIINSGEYVGVIVRKTSSSKYPTNVKITNNNITTSNEYAINAADADPESYLIENNSVGTSLINTPNGVVNPSDYIYTFNGTSYIITPGNYSEFFDAKGNMASFIKDGDILIFRGSFENKELQITNGVKITGDMPRFANTTFKVTASNVWIENLTIKNSRSKTNCWAIYIEETNKVKVTNNDIEVEDSKAAYAIYNYQSDNVEITNNRLASHGDYLTYTVLSYGVEDCKIINNTIKTIGTGQLHLYEAEKCIDGENTVKEIFRTYGILMIYSSDNIVSENNVEVTSLVSSPQATVNGNFSTNSLVGIDIYYDSDNNRVTNNNVYVHGNDNYLYGMGVIGAPTGSSGSYSANDNRFLNNNINVEGNFFGSGLIAGYSSVNTRIQNNNISVKSNNVSYGITLEMSKSSDVGENALSLNSQIIYGLEAYNSNNNEINYNNITGNGVKVYGIAGSSSSNNLITKNNIIANGNGNEITAKNYDSIKYGNAGIYLQALSANNRIIDNNITSAKGYPINLDSFAKNNNIANNYLKGELASGNEGVNNSNGNVVNNNYIYEFKRSILNNATADYIDNASITLNTDTDDALVRFYLDSNFIGNATVRNGKAVLNYQLPEKYVVGVHHLEAVISKDLYKSISLDGELTISKAKISLEVGNFTTKSGKTTKISATVKNMLNKSVSNIVVKFYLNGEYLGRAIANSRGNASVNVNIANSLSEGNYQLTATVDETTNYRSAENKGTVTIDNRIQPNIVLANVTMYFKDGTQLKGQVLDENGSPITGIELSISINSNIYKRTTDEKGSFAMNLNLNSGYYPVYLQINKSSKYHTAHANATVNIKSTVNGVDITKIYKNQTQYYAKFTDKNGEKLASGITVSFNINGVFYNRTTDENGIARLNINLAQGTYILTANNPLTGENAANTIRVLPSISENTDITKYYRNGTQYVVKLIGANGKSVGEGQKVSFNINGIFYERTTNKTGYAQLNLNLQPGDYIITADYNGCKVSNKIKIKPVLSAKDLTKSYGDKTPFETKLVDGQGNALQNKTVKFNINGVFYDRTTDENGTAKLNINLQKGQYIITSSYNDSNIANKVTVN